MRTDLSSVFFGTLVEYLNTFFFQTLKLEFYSSYYGTPFKFSSNMQEYVKNRSVSAK